MFRTLTIAAACAALACAACGEGDEAGVDAGPVEAGAVLADAQAAMGTAELESIAYSGAGWLVWNASFLQTPSASPPWPGYDVRNYQRAIDFGQPASRAAGDMFHGGLFMEQPTERPYTQHVRGGQGNWSQELEIWLTPWGFLEGAAPDGGAGATETLDGEIVRVISWTTPDSLTSPSGTRYTVTGYIDAADLVRRVETRVEDPMLGDMLVRNLYEDYAETDGVMVPGTIAQLRGAGDVVGEVFRVSVEQATINPPDVAERLTPPDAPGGGGPAPPGGPGRGGGEPPAPADLVTEVDEGVYTVGGGYVALVVEFADHVAIFEAGQSEARGQQIVEAVSAVLPDKEIRYVINSHPHSDHSSGIAPFLRAGATLITHRNNVEAFEAYFGNSRELLGEPTVDPVIEGVEDMRVLEDDTNRLELYSVPNEHTDGMLVALVPGAGLLHQADFTLPQPGAEPNRYVVTLAERVDELGLDFDTYSSVHAAAQPQTKAQLMAALE